MTKTSMRTTCAALLALVLAFSASCSLYDKPYRTKEAVGSSPDAAGKNAPNYALKYIESDDRGWFWDPAQASETLSLVKSSIDTGDTLVLLFIHGWHHSAACYDSNLESFKRVLNNLHDVLGEEMYQSARRAANGNAEPPPVKIIGVYIGWRGRSLPGLIDYGTFWGRKSAAQRVGQGDLQEFMARLQRIYDDHSTPPPGAQKTPFFGLVSIGHSFGGAVLLASTSRYFESEMQMANPHMSYLRQSPKPLPAAPSSAASAAAAPVLRGFGDLVVLVNPAVEAAAYERINLLSRTMNYSPAQTPLLITFSAENDGPRHSLFTAGRIAGEFFTSASRVDDDRERAAERQALGVYDYDQTGFTHTLKPVTDGKELVSTEDVATTDVQCGNESLGKYDWWTWKKKDSAPDDGSNDSLNVSHTFDTELATKVYSYDFSQNLHFSGVSLNLMQDASGKTRPFVQYQPFMDVTVDPSIINGHNGIFTEPFMSFLLRYIGFVEAKRFLLTKQGDLRLKAPQQ